MLEVLTDLVWINKCYILWSLKIDFPLESMETKQQINFKPRISANRPLNNSALIIKFNVLRIFLHLLYAFNDKE